MIATSTILAASVTVRKIWLVLAKNVGELPAIKARSLENEKESPPQQWTNAFEESTETRPEQIELEEKRQASALIPASH